MNNTHFCAGIQAYGSAFMCLYYFSDTVHSYSELNTIWETLVASGSIVEGVVKDYAAVLTALGIPATYTGMYSPVLDHIGTTQFAYAELATIPVYHVALNRNRKIVYSPDATSTAPKTKTLKVMRVFTYTTED